jgi:hypothetical protein
MIEQGAAELVEHVRGCVVSTAFQPVIGLSGGEIHALRGAGIGFVKSLSNAYGDLDERHLQLLVVALCHLFQVRPEAGRVGGNPAFGIETPGIGMLNDAGERASERRRKKADDSNPVQQRHAPCIQSPP